MKFQPPVKIENSDKEQDSEVADNVVPERDPMEDVGVLASSEAGAEKECPSDKHTPLKHEDKILSVVERLVARSKDSRVHVDETEFPTEVIVTAGNHEYLHSHTVVNWLKSKMGRDGMCVEPMNDHLVRVWNENDDHFDVYCLRVRYNEDGVRSSLEEYFVLYREPMKFYDTKDDVMKVIPASVSFQILLLCELKSQLM